MIYICTTLYVLHCRIDTIGTISTINLIRDLMCFPRFRGDEAYLKSVISNHTRHGAGLSTFILFTIGSELAIQWVI